MMDFPY